MASQAEFKSEESHLDGLLEGLPASGPADRVSPAAAAENKHRSRRCDRYVSSPAPGGTTLAQPLHTDPAAPRAPPSSLDGRSPAPNQRPGRRGLRAPDRPRGRSAARERRQRYPTLKLSCSRSGLRGMRVPYAKKKGRHSAFSLIQSRHSDRESARPLLLFYPIQPRQPELRTEAEICALSPTRKPSFSSARCLTSASRSNRRS